jgi:diguanylate cyclase (GGDEF)-like protein/PAS domain S-box-containing protein
VSLALDQLPCGVLVFCDNSRVLSANKVLLDLLGYRREEVEGQLLDALLPLGTRVFFQTHLLPLLRLQGTVEEIHVSLQAKAGEVVPVLLNGSRNPAVDGTAVSYTCALFRIERRHAYEDELLRMRNELRDLNEQLQVSLRQIRIQADRDELTEVLNRRALMRVLERERARAERGAIPFSVALVDLDFFKAINDNYGHITGDKVLRRFAERAQAVLRVSDALGRYGGEEFMVILPGTAAEAAGCAVERIRKATAEMTWDDVAPGLQVTVSAGFAGFRPGEKLEQLISRADAALYNAKRAGRNRLEKAD